MDMRHPMSSPRPLDRVTGRPLDVGRSWALFLDVDGTLLHIAETPDSVQVSNRLRALLARLGPALGGALALISGRPVAELDRLFDPLALPAAGLHGLEHRGAAGGLDTLGDPRALDGLRSALGDFAGRHPGVLLEDKGRALAVHYRRAPDAEAAARDLVARLTEGRGDDLRVVEGKMVIEIKPRLADKGAAVEAFMAEPPFAGRLPVFIGDDVTDEDAFAAVERMGGHSIRVGEAPDSRAHFLLADVDEAVGWLEHLAVAAESEGKAPAP